MKLYYIDLFCGAGGTSTGVEQAMFENRKCAEVIACVNHDANAIASHLANHPKAVHYTEDIRTLELSPLVRLAGDRRRRHPGDKLVLWASLECTNFSKAKGGQPRNADSRTLAEHLFRYIDALKPDYIQIENVEEFMCWGELDEHGKPVSKTAGSCYVRWVNNVCRRGYRFEWRVLNAADYGAYTTRKRFFGIFAKRDLPIAFPVATHSRHPERGLFDELKPWKAVRDCLDLTDGGKSIFDRKKPLSDATLKRILAGLEKFAVKGQPEFLVKYNSMSRKGKYVAPGINEPCPVVATQNRLGLCKTHFLVKNFSGDPRSKSVSIDGPSGTVTCIDHHSFITVYNGKGRNVSLDAPAPTVTTKDRLGYVNVTQFIDNQYGNSGPSEITRPCGTLLTNPKQRLVSVKRHYIVNPQYDWPVTDVAAPCPTVIARQDKRPLMLMTSECGDCGLRYEADDSVVMKQLKDFCNGNGIVDVSMRMLRIDELKKIMGFPEGYKLVGSQAEQKKFIGNAVECGMARQLCESVYSGLRCSGFC